MPPPSHLRFDVGPADLEQPGDVGLTPVVDGVPLTDLVNRFESEHVDPPAGGYAGLVPANFRFGDLTRYYLGTGERQWPEPGVAWLLGCPCGEPGCWPLEVDVVLAADTVTWSDLRQPHRPGRDYGGLGPFVFDRAAYVSAVQAALDQLPPPPPEPAETPTRASLFR